MKLLSLLHRWTGGLVGLLLAVIGLSGTALLWEDSWILLDGAKEAAVGNPQELAHAVAVAFEAGPGLTRVTFAGKEIGLHQAIYADGSGAYIAQDGAVVDRWTSPWERPELWLFEIHHYLLLGETGKTLTGVLGILLLGFTVTGFVLWWRTRRTFRFRLWPARFTASAIVRHHRDLGVVASPLLIVAAATGTLMVFPALSALLLSAPAQGRMQPPLLDSLEQPNGKTDWERILTNAQTIFPAAEPRRLMMPSAPGAPIAIRFRQEFEWAPNGRSYVWVAPGEAAVVARDDPAEGDAGSAIVEKFYPVHAAKTGGLAWRILVTFAGLTLALLGLLASFSFWRTKYAVSRRGGAGQKRRAVPT